MLQNIINKYNKTALFVYDSELERDFCTLADLLAQTDDKKKVFTLQALFINDKSKFGKAPVAVVGEFLVNLPSHLTEVAELMRADEDFIKLVNDRKVGFTIYTFDNKYGVQYSVEWVEINQG